MNWRPHTQAPDGLTTAILATRDEDGFAYLLASIYMWHDGRWTTEDEREAEPSAAEFWWLPEIELLAALQK